MRESVAVRVALEHIDAWSHHDWAKTQDLLAPNVRAVVTSIQPNGDVREFVGIDDYMAVKVKAAQLIEPGSVEVLSAVGDERQALIAITFRIGLGPDGSMVSMARSCLSMIDTNQKIQEERDTFFVLTA